MFLIQTMLYCLQRPNTTTVRSTLHFRVPLYTRQETLLYHTAAKTPRPTKTEPTVGKEKVEKSIKITSRVINADIIQARTCHIHQYQDSNFCSDIETTKLSPIKFYQTVI